MKYIPERYTDKEGYKRYLDELRTAITLANGKYLPHLEEEIFSNYAVAGYYLKVLSTTRGYSNYKRHNLARFIVTYMRTVKLESWPAAEVIIYKDTPAREMFIRLFPNSPKVVS